MPSTNAVAKVRFSSAKPQRVRLEETDRLASELLCLEGGQQLRITEPSTILYVILGVAEVHAGEANMSVATGCLVAPGEAFTLSNAGEQRLVCLACKAVD